MIVNGESVTDGELPFQVLVTAQWTDHGGSWTSTCGRSLIAPQWVLTAAHCLVRDGGAFAPGELVVGFGSVYRSKLRRIRVDKAFVHDGSIRCRRTTSVCKLKKPIPDAKTVEFASRTKEGLLRGWGKALGYPAGRARDAIAGARRAESPGGASRDHVA